VKKEALAAFRQIPEKLPRPLQSRLQQPMCWPGLSAAGQRGRAGDALKKELTDRIKSNRRGRPVTADLDSRAAKVKVEDPEACTPLSIRDCKKPPFSCAAGRGFRQPDLRNLGETDVQRLTQCIAELEHVKPEMAVSVLEEYYQLTLTQSYLATGGPEYAEKLLVKASGSRREAASGAGFEDDGDEHVRLDNLENADPQAACEVSRNRTSANHRPHSRSSERAQGIRCWCACPRKIRRKPSSGWRNCANSRPRWRRRFQLRCISAGVSREQSRRGLCGLQGSRRHAQSDGTGISKSILENIEKKIRKWRWPSAI